MSESAPRPVLVLGADGSVDVFDSLGGAALYLEPIDVAKGEVAAIVDDSGHWYEAVVVRRGARVWPWGSVDAVRVGRVVARARDRDAERVLLERLRSYVGNERVREILDTRGVDTGELSRTDDVWKIVRTLCNAWPRTR